MITSQDPPKHIVTALVYTFVEYVISFPQFLFRFGIYWQPRTFVQRALLYNDGGFDVSPDGLTLCACAEYWLPDGIDNVMELKKYQEDEEEDEDEEEEEEDDNDDDDDDSEKTDQHCDVHDVNNDDDDLGYDDTATQQHAHVPTGQEQASCTTNVSAPAVTVVWDQGSSPRRPPLPQSTPMIGISTSSSFQGSLQGQLSQSQSQQSSSQPLTPVGGGGIPPMTPPPNATQPPFPLSPPSPPGRRFTGGLGQHQSQQQQQTVPPAPQRPIRRARTTPTSGTVIPPPPAPLGIARPTFDNPLATPTQTGNSNNGMATQTGRFVPHVVTISLDTTPFFETTLVPVSQASSTSSHSAGVMSLHPQAPPMAMTTQTTLNIPGRGAYATSSANGGSADHALRPQSLHLRPRLGQLLEACPLDGAKASAVTCVKFSPSTDFCLIGYGVREPVMEDPHGNQYHPVTALYRIRGGMTHVSTMLSGDDDVNIARFHPDSGYGFVYGTKQGRVRVMSRRPCNYYNC
jgi:hypothetical protein